MFSAYICLKTQPRALPTKQLSVTMWTKTSHSPLASSCLVCFPPGLHMVISHGFWSLQPLFWKCGLIKTFLLVNVSEGGGFLIKFISFKFTRFWTPPWGGSLQKSSKLNGHAFELGAQKDLAILVFSFLSFPGFPAKAFVAFICSSLEHCCLSLESSQSLSQN